MEVPRIDKLLETLAAAEPVPGSGSAAALAGAMAAALCTKVARLSGDGGAAAQGRALCERLTALADEDARLYRAALDQLERRDDNVALGEAVAHTADALLRIAESSTDVAALAGALAAHATPEHQAEARAAAALAAGATRASAALVEANLTVTSDDERVRLARRLSEQAEADAGR